jgi:PLP dependent protein
MQSIKNNIDVVLDEIKQITFQKVTLIAVTKYSTLEQMEVIINAGIINLGENKIQDLIFKKNYFYQYNLTWHFIGHLQSNKVKKAVQYADFIQSVDSLKILNLINIEAEKINKKISVLLQINIANEENKFGFSIEEFMKNIQYFKTFLNINFKGIMFIAPYLKEELILRRYFKKTFELYNELKNIYVTVNTLSMGMSNDYKFALQEGSNMIRLGSILKSN